MDIIILLLSILAPIIAGVMVGTLRIQNRSTKLWLVAAALVLELGCALVLMGMEGRYIVLFSMTDTLSVALKMDGVSKLFMLVASLGYLLAGVFSFKYMTHSEREDQFFAFYLVSLGMIFGMDLAGNLITMYLFFEMITLSSMPLVLHDRTEESVRAALKYLYYSIAGAFLALCTIFFLARYSTTLDFNAGGNLNIAELSGHENLLRVVIFAGVLGFGAKAGMYPLHGWLPTAHPVAPAPASAVLSGIIAKAGVLAIIRVVFFSVGTDFLRGTWVQSAWLAVALLTVFMGSMMAYREKVLKKRLAYSTVSQISYVLTGLFFMSAESVMGGLMHVLFHAVIKVGLFLSAGSIIFNLGKTRVDELRGCGKAMPITLWGYTIASLGLIGIPPCSGFVSKWYLAEGALGSGMAVFSYLAPVVLLISALLTAGYLLPITIDGFFPGKGAALPERGSEGGWMMYLPVVIGAALTLLFGIFAQPLAMALLNVAEAML